MKRKEIFYLSVLIICSIVTSYSFTLSHYIRKIYPETETAAKQQYNTTSVQTKYTISEFNGKIAVYYNDNIIPDEIYDAYTDSLPADDAINLSKGITVYSREELQKLIEDYTS